MVVSGIQESTFHLLIGHMQRGTQVVAKHQGRIRGILRKAGEIHIPELAGLQGLTLQGRKDSPGPSRGPGPIETLASAKIMGKSYSAHPMDGGLSHSRHRTGQVNIRAQVTA